MGRRTALSLLGLLLLGAGAWRFLRAPSEASGPASSANQTAARAFAKKLAAIALPPAGSTAGQAEFTEAEIDALIDSAIAAIQATSMRDMGKVMARLRSDTQGRADMGAVSAKVRARLK